MPNYTTIQRQYDMQYNIITINNEEITVWKHLPTLEKIDIIQIALQKADEGGYYNDLKLDAYFHLNIVYSYTNIEFSAEDRADELKLFDDLKQSGILDEILSAMDEDEYNELELNLNAYIEYKMQYGNSAAAVLRSFIEDLPVNAAAAAQIVDNFDPKKFGEVVKFAEAANGGRPISQ